MTPLGLHKVVKLIEQQAWLDQIADPVQQFVTNAFNSRGSAGQQAKDLLNGVWLGHALHPVLTDLPIGFWTAALVLDLGGGDLEDGADTLVALGLLSAVPTAAAGLADWQYTTDAPRRLGVVHGMLNVAGVVLYAISLIQRLSGGRGAGRATAFTGYAVASASSYLGGSLIVRHHLSVDRANELPPPQDFVRVLAESELADGKPHRAEANGVPVVLVRQNGQIRALAATCSHMAGPLDEGTVEDGSIICPWHGSRFNLESGQIQNGPATFPQPCFEARVRDGQIEVRAAQT
jgi:nitrite reductase/ring-hydroxylating ferredoxin subunit/uncharacterized membrane protein